MKKLISIIIFSLIFSGCGMNNIGADEIPSGSLPAIDYDAERTILLGAENDEITGYSSRIVNKTGAETTQHFHAGHIAYKNNGVFYPSDFTLEDMGKYWRMVYHNYKLFIAKDFSRNQLIRFDNVYEGANHSIIYEPRALAWVNKTDLSDFQIFRNQQAVQGYIKDGNIIRYDNAFGDGLHFEITLLRSGFKKEIVIEAKNKLELPPTAKHKLVALFQYTGNGLKIKSNDKLRQWTSGYFEETNGFRIQEEANEVFQSFIRPAYIIDDGSDDGSGIKNQENIKVFWKLHNGKLYQAKVLPTKFLKNAVYPVRADTTTSYYSGAGDANVYHESTAKWDTAHDATTGNGVDGWGTTIAKLNCGKASSGWSISRCFFPTDTSSLPDGAEISGAIFKFYVSAVTNGDNDGDDWFNIVGETTQANTTSLTTADFDTCGSVNNPTEGATRIDLSSVSAGWVSLIFNATGIGWINKTGYTKFGIREGHDCIDSPVTNTKGIHNGLDIRNSRFTGTDSDPYLEITYTEGGGATAAPVRQSDFWY